MIDADDDRRPGLVERHDGAAGEARIDRCVEEEELRAEQIDGARRDALRDPPCERPEPVAGVAEPGSGPTGGSLTFVNIAGVPQPQAELSIYYQHSQSVPITAAVTVNGVTTVLNFPPVPLGATGPSRIALTIPGQTISTVKITGVQGTSSSSLTIDSVTVQ